MPEMGSLVRACYRFYTIVHCQSAKSALANQIRRNGACYGALANGRARDITWKLLWASTLIITAGVFRETRTNTAGSDLILAWGNSDLQGFFLTFEKSLVRDN